MTLQEDALVQLGGREVNGSGSGLRTWSTIASFLGQDSEELFDPDIMVKVIVMLSRVFIYLPPLFGRSVKKI